MTVRRALGVMVITVAASGCGKKGPPLAPLVDIPAAVGQLTARRVGEEVVLTLALPTKNVDESTPVVCVATESPVLDKVLSNVEEVRARGAETIAIATEGCERVGEVADRTIEVARTDWIVQPIVAILPLQLLAYAIARARGLNVDQPRNLAKTVTVE